MRRPDDDQGDRVEPRPRPPMKRPSAKRPPSPRLRARVLRALASLPAIGFACAAYAYLTLPDVRPLRAINPETSAFIELRGREAAARGTPQLPAQRWMNYS